jgi:type IV pilus assembly protein PilV
MPVPDFSFLKIGGAMIKSIHRGFTLVEVLIAVFVLSLGMIGISSLQLNVLRTARQSAYQNSALRLAAEMADLIAAYRSHAAPSNPFLGLDYNSSVDADAVPARFCHASDCSADELAAFEIHEWKARLKASLPAGRVRICRDANPWDSAAEAYRWTCGAGAAGEPLVIKIGWRHDSLSVGTKAGGSKTTAPALAFMVGGLSK